MKTEHAIIKNNTLCIMTETGSILRLGISGFKNGLDTIKSSKAAKSGTLAESTKQRMNTYEQGIELWESRA